MAASDVIGLKVFEANATDAVGLLRALANENRLTILCQLGERELQVSQLQAAVKLSQSALSQHLAILREQQLVTTRREGTAIFYRIRDRAALEVIAVLAAIYPPTSPSCPEPAARRARRA